MSDRSIMSAADHFESRRELYGRFTQKLEALLCDLLGQSDLKFHKVEGRVKGKSETRLKLEEKQYDDPIEQLTDFSGLRIVAYDLESVVSICDMLEAEFRILPEFSIDKGTELAPSEFGYQSVHFIVQLSDSRAQLTEYQPYASLKAEIQVRTVLQHGWAVINHAIRYKRREDLPHELGRQLIRCAALVEEVDTQFRAVLGEVTRLQRHIIDSLASGDLNLEITFDSLEGYIKESTELRALAATAQTLGYSVHDQISSEHYQRRLSGAVKMSKFVGLDTLDQLNGYLISSGPWAPQWLRDLMDIGARDQLKEGIPPCGAPLSVLRHMLVGHIDPSLTVEQLDQCACGGAVTADLVAARLQSAAGREKLD